MLTLPASAPSDKLVAVSFSTSLGWIALAANSERLVRVAIGNRTSRQAVAAVSVAGAVSSRQPQPDWLAELEERLQSYAGGGCDDFRDVPVDLDHLSPFEAGVVAACRRIAYGETLCYGRLARLAGYAGAARAVGNVMASNRYPLIVPCHRVVKSDGSIGRFSAPAGSRLKAQLLDMETPGQEACSRLKMAKRVSAGQN